MDLDRDAMSHYDTICAANAADDALVKLLALTAATYEDARALIGLTMALASLREAVRFIDGEHPTQLREKGCACV